MSNVFNRPVASRNPFKRALQRAIYFMSLLLNQRRRTTISRAAGFRLLVPPTVFHPRYFLTSEFFASFLDSLDLSGKRVADVGTGTGILALAAARAGASTVIAIDINPNAARAAAENARLNGLEGISAVSSDLLSAFAPGPLFDIVLANPPDIPGEASDLADQAWQAGCNYRVIAPLFEQTRERLAPGGCMYVLLSSEADLDALSALVEHARFRVRLVRERSHFIESVLLYELQPD